MKKLALIAMLLFAVPAVEAQTLAPLVVDWDRYFSVDSQAGVCKGHAIVSGYVINVGMWGTKRIQLLVEGLDAGGHVVGQQVTWLGVDLGPGMRSYFEVPAPAPAASYRVRVFAFDRKVGNTAS